MTARAALALVLAACGSSSAPEASVAVAPAAPVVAPPSGTPAWETPAGWRTETIPFPLEFAPSIAHAGVEELRFPAGFLKAGDDWFWSYAFVWHLAAPGPADRGALERELIAYFAGLALAVGGVDRADVTRASLTGELAGGIRGRVDAFDAFATKAPVALTIAISEPPCATAGHRALVFIASPRPVIEGDPVWTELRRLAAAFRCP